MPTKVETFKPFSDEYLEDPYAFFSPLRKSAPVLFVPGLKYWVVTRYDDVRWIFQNPAIFSASNALDPIRPVCPVATDELRRGGFSPVPTLTNTDPPVHTRARRLANAAFTPGRVASMEAFVRRLTLDFVDELLVKRNADLIKDFAWSLPARVLCRILGIPDEDIGLIKQGSSSRLLFMFGNPTDAQQMELARDLARFWSYAQDLTSQRQQSPRDDFVSNLVHRTHGNEPILSLQEVSTIVFGLLLAGHETTTNLLGNAFRRILEAQDAWKALVSQKEIIPNAIEEVLRFDSSVITWRRKTTQAVEIGGIEVPARADLLLLIGSANRDPSVFVHPDTFDIYRHNAKAHLSFGHGPHLCLGAPLARLEVRVALEELVRHLPSLRLSDGQTFTYPPNVSFRGPRSLLVEWG